MSRKKFQQGPLKEFRLKNDSKEILLRKVAEEVLIETPRKAEIFINKIFKYDV